MMMLSCFLLVASLSARAYPAYDVTVRGLGAISLECDDGKARTVAIAYPRAHPNGVQLDEHSVISHSARAKARRSGRALPGCDAHSNCVVQVTAKDFGTDIPYFLLPHFHRSRGLYDHRDVVRFMPEWRKTFKLVPERELDFRFETREDENCTRIYLDGSLAGRLEGAVRVTGAKAASGLEIVRQTPRTVRAAVGCHELPPIPHRAHADLMSGARLSVGVGEQVVAGVPMTVWAPEQSVDQGRHRQTTANRDLVWNPMNERTPWATGPEYFQWRVPGKTWLTAHVLCADIPEKGREPWVGTHLALFGRGCTAGNIDFEAVNLADTASADRIRKVGTLTYRKDGRAVTTPLYLVTVRLEPATLGERGRGQPALDFEFVGAGRPDRYPRSSVQIFGCTLEEAPFSFSIDNPVRGNLFERGRDEQASELVVTANRDDVKGALEIEVHDPLFRPLKRMRQEFSIARRGENRRLRIDLSGFGIGWYGMDLTFRDADGGIVARHEAAFTVLHADDREAGYESPYAAWPLAGGKHGANTNRFEQLEVMRKAGYRKTWQPPCTNEAEGAAYKVTLSSPQIALKACPPPATRAEWEAWLDGTVGEYRKAFADFPHCTHIQILHESGGKTISAEVRDGVRGVRGPYRGWCDDWSAPTNRDAWLVFYCTEFAKRMKKEFPDKRIFIGNGSSSCERIAALCRNGFDLALVDELGIESKGFSSMPEFAANQESPGMLWALRETGRAFGYGHLGLNACNEYVFRPERTVGRDWPVRRIMQVTDYTLRDYLISLAHGCSIISTGHLEDCNDSYYETNWGAGGQCKFYPYSYPKRMFTALAVLTRALDRAEYVRRVPTGEITSYALEFRRNRRKADFAYALWTPRYGATVGLTFPAGTGVTRIDAFGAESPLAPGERGETTVEIGSTPTYVIATKAVESARVVAHATERPPEGTKELLRLSSATVVQSDRDLGSYGNGWGVPPPVKGKFDLHDVSDSDRGRALELRLVPEGEVPAVRWESASLQLSKPVRFRLSEVGGFGLWVRGNGSFSMCELLVRGVGRRERPQVLPMGRDRGFVAFDGWQFLSFDTVRDEKGRPRDWKGMDEVEIVAVVCGSARMALDPIEMVPVTAHLALGPIAVVPRAETASGSETVDRDEANDAMKTVEEKDL